MNFFFNSLVVNTRSKSKTPAAKGADTGVDLTANCKVELKKITPAFNEGPSKGPCKAVPIIRPITVMVNT